MNDWAFRDCFVICLAISVLKYIAMLPNRKNIRLRNYDYASNGLYFITICTQRHECFLGKITDGIMDCSPIGLTAELFWNEIPNHYPHIELGRYVIMPNHVHGIIRLLNAEKTSIPNIPELSNYNTFGKPIPESISSIIGQFKATLTRWCNANHLSYFGWQPRFYDHVIRNKDEFYKIDNYIANNAANWDADKFYRIP